MKMPAYVTAVLGSTLPEWLSNYPEDTQVAALRLVSDERMRPLWGSSFVEAQLQNAVDGFEHATDRDAWTNLSQRARDEWKAKLEKNIDTLLQLLKEGPRTPEQWGFPARDNVLMNVAFRWGVALPDADSPEFFPKMMELEKAADAECWTIADSLKHYRQQLRLDCESTQVLKKPGDRMAGRAEFIIWFRSTSKLSAQETATVASVMFDDEAIDDRLVRRLTAGREHS